jgi:uncharacterized protein (TIGR03437 family)
MKSLQIVSALLLASSVAQGQQFVIQTIAGIPQVPGYFGDGYPANEGQLYQPLRVAVDSNKNVYIADFYTYAVREVTASTGLISTIAGNGTPGFQGDGEVATNGEITDVHGLAVDSKGNVYFSDTSNFRIRKVDTSGNITTFAGNGTRGYTGDGAAATSAELWFPSGVAVDGSGNVYVSDWGNYTVRKISSSGMISTVAGTGVWGYSGDGGPANKANLAFPGSIALDSAGNLYIGDYGNNTIRKVGSDGNIHTIASNVSPQSLAIDAAGNIYFVDGLNPVVQELVGGGALLTIAGTGQTGFGGDAGGALYAQLDRPSGVAVDSSGNVYIADTDNDVIRQMMPVAFSVGGVTNAASSIQGPVAPGEIVTVYGAGMGPATLTTFTPSNGFIGTQIANASVYFNAVPAPLIYVSATVSAAIVPYSVAGLSQVDVVLTNQGNVSSTTVVPVASTAPGIFTANTTGTGQASAVNQDGSLNSAANPAKVGSFVSLYLTGEGQTTPAGVNGKLALAPPYPMPILPVTATVGGLSAVVNYAGAAPTSVAGLMQVNVQIPASVTPGSAVPVQVLVGGVAAQSGVTIAVTQ